MSENPVVTKKITTQILIVFHLQPNCNRFLFHLQPSCNSGLLLLSLFFCEHITYNIPILQPPLLLQPQPPVKQQYSFLYLYFLLRFIFTLARTLENQLGLCIKLWFHFPKTNTIILGRQLVLQFLDAVFVYNMKLYFPKQSIACKLVHFGQLYIVKTS